MNIGYHINKMRKEGTLVRHGSTKGGKWIIRSARETE